MHVWRTSYDPKTRGHRHTVARGHGHALLSPVAATVFRILRISAALWEHGQEWLPLHAGPSLGLLEFEHGKDADRSLYNDRCLAQVELEKRIVCGEHAGCSDFFVPIIVRKRLVAVLVVGSFLRAPLSSADVHERWRVLTGREAHPSDPEFSGYFAALLSILVLDAVQMGALERLLHLLARLLSGEGAAGEIMNEVEALRAELEVLRFPERTWELMRDIVDDQSGRNPHSGPRGTELQELGLTTEADHVLVGLSLSRDATLDPVEEALRRHSFQRSAVHLARKSGHAVSGKVGDHGVVLFSGTKGSP
ncbi:MAG TPA: hypothetical protein VGP93_14700, partial [Polyangiaceae bacterium]|nr:hypothetical protein [Polyangiaceae bacterium]